MGAGGGVGIAGPEDCWNDGELQEEATHARRSASDVSTAVEVRERRRQVAIDDVATDDGRLVAGIEHRCIHSAAVWADGERARYVGEEIDDGERRALHRAQRGRGG